MKKGIKLILVEPKDLIRHHERLYAFPLFHNYLQFALKHLPYKIWVDSNENPQFVILYSFPAYFLLGDPKGYDVTLILKMIDENRWVVPENENWEIELENYFGNKIEAHKRTKFSSRNLSLEHLESLKKPLPKGYQLIQVTNKQVQDEEGMLYNDLLKNYFPNGDFLVNGVGFCILEDDQVIGFSASNYPIENQVLEVYIRVDFNSDPRHRQKGFGTILSIALLEYCLSHNLDPHWDSANDISAHLAIKLGYEIERTWKMYHII